MGRHPGVFAEGTSLGRQVHWKFVEGYRARAEQRNLATRFTGFRAMLPHTYGYGADRLMALLDEWRLKSTPSSATPTTPDQPLPANWNVQGKTMTITLDPQSAQARHRRGVELTMAGRLEEALAELEAAQQLYPFSYDIQLDKAVTLRFLERFLEALEVCDAAMAVLVIPPATLLLVPPTPGRRAPGTGTTGSSPGVLPAVVGPAPGTSLCRASSPPESAPLGQAGQASGGGGSL